MFNVIHELTVLKEFYDFMAKCVLDKKVKNTMSTTKQYVIES